MNVDRTRDSSNHLASQFLRQVHHGHLNVLKQVNRSDAVVFHVITLLGWKVTAENR
jgi:hypothetical protein